MKEKFRYNLKDKRKQVEEVKSLMLGLLLVGVSRNDLMLQIN